MRGERGSASTVVAAGALVLGLFALAAADLGIMVVARARAHAAAEAAALAAAVRQAPVLGQDGSPADAARDAAEANGARLVSCACEPETTTAAVETSVAVRTLLIGAWSGEVRASARAELDPHVLSYRS